MPDRSEPRLSAQSIDWGRIHERLDSISMRLADGDSPEALAARMAQRAQALAAPEERTGPAPGDDLVVFGLAGQRYAIDIPAAEAVVPIDQLVPLPGLGAAHLGLLMHRGLLYAVVDVNALLDRPVAEPATPAFAVLLNDPGCAIGLAADALFGVAREATPERGGAGAGLLCALLPDGTGVLDAEALSLSARLVVDHRLRPSSPP
ncbi:chemotaxis protein CheW [Xanthobacter pseudotagetidis]|uniref:chemotaxis protein CheW n=1 Tax=Xanthobacter pseudotagetidis TaxID=3119911 RepID=UPI00372C31C4